MNTELLNQNDIALIKQAVASVVREIQKNERNSIELDYFKFLKNLVSQKDRKITVELLYNVLQVLDTEFKQNNVTYWLGRARIENLKDITNEGLITFRTDAQTNIKLAEERQQLATIDYAGTVNISKSKSNIKLYKHQIEAITRLNDNIIKSRRNHFGGMLVLPTGGGKTLTAGYWVAQNYLDKGKKVLWIAHRHELLEQAKYTFHTKLAYNDIFLNKESFNYRIISGIHDKPINIRKTDDIIFASKDSLQGDAFDYLYKNWIENNINELLLIIDEAHHSTAKTYKRLIDNIKKRVNNKLIMLGLTATPWRMAEKEKGLLKMVYPDDIQYSIDIRTLIKTGILSEPIFEDVETGINLIREAQLTKEQIRKLQTSFGDFDSILGEKTAKIIAENKERNMLIVNQYLKNKDKYNKTIVFALNIDHAIALNALFQAKGVKSDFIVSTKLDSKTGISISAKENEEKINKFRKGDLDVLINVNILTEGVDVPNINTIFLARPTRSTILMNQMVGRGLRGTRVGGTKEAYIVNIRDDWKLKKGDKLEEQDIKDSSRKSKGGISRNHKTTDKLASLEDLITWINPKQLFYRENPVIEDKEYERRKQIIRIISLEKIEEFAILNNQIIDPVLKNAIERINFIDRIPLGIYNLEYLLKTDQGEDSVFTEVLVYNNLKQPYEDFIHLLPKFFKEHNLTERDYLTDEELDKLAYEIEYKIFRHCEQYPAYSIQDIKNILQYYTVVGALPVFVKFEDREKYNIDEIAREIREKDMGQKTQEIFEDEIWENEKIGWQIFFNYDKITFLNEINLALTKLRHPEEYQKPVEPPTEVKEQRRFENMNLSEIYQVDRKYYFKIKNEVFNKYKDQKGYYFSALSGKRSRKKEIFQIDHIIPISKGGKTVLDNLQLLTKKEKQLKG